MGLARIRKLGSARNLIMPVCKRLDFGQIGLGVFQRLVLVALVIVLLLALVVFLLLSLLDQFNKEYVRVKMLGVPNRSPISSTRKIAKRKSKFESVNIFS